jgi:hypothetical protein
MYGNGKVRPVESIPGIGGGRIKNDREVLCIHILIYCKNFSKCYNVSPAQQLKKIWELFNLKKKKKRI